MAVIEKENKFFIEIPEKYIDYDIAQKYLDPYSGEYIVLSLPNVTDLDSGSFHDSNIKKVKLPKHLKILPENCFALSTVSDINVSNLEYVGSEAFHACHCLENLNFKNLKELGSAAFSDSYITKLSFPKIEKLGYAAFANSELETIKLNDSLEEIPASCFTHCYNLKSIKLPSNLKVIDSYAFNTTGLTSIKLPNTLKILGTEVFYDCYYLDYIYYDGPEENFKKIKNHEQILELKRSLYFRENIESLLNKGHTFKEANDIIVAQERSWCSTK